MEQNTGVNLEERLNEAILDFKLRAKECEITYKRLEKEKEKDIKKAKAVTSFYLTEQYYRHF